LYLIEPPKHLKDILSLNTSITIQDIISTSRCILEAHAVLGFIRFLGYFYIVLCTKKEVCGSINAHLIYTVTATQMIPISPSPALSHNFLLHFLFQFNKTFNQTSLESAERKYLTLFQCVDLTKEMYFSHTYDLTRTQQKNYMNPSPRLGGDDSVIWNHHLIFEWQSLLTECERSLWIIPLVHGFYQQKRFSSFGKMIDVILIGNK
jgi:phosphatidylinositol 3,5-bisphosphate 5-phosphatase